MAWFGSVIPRRIGPKSARPPKMNLSWLVTNAATWVWSLLSLQMSSARLYLVPLMVTPPVLLTYATPAFAACRNERPNDASAPPCSASMPISIVLPLAAPADEPPDAPPEEAPDEEPPDDEHAAKASVASTANSATGLRVSVRLTLAAFMVTPLLSCPADR